jgi:hypothetical protein
MGKPNDVQEGSSNIFADLGISDRKGFGQGGAGL